MTDLLDRILLYVYLFIYSYILAISRNSLIDLTIQIFILALVTVNLNPFFISLPHSLNPPKAQTHPAHFHPLHIMFALPKNRVFILKATLKY